MPEKVRFTLSVDGAERNLFSIQQRKNGDLTIGFGFASHYGPEPGDPEILHQKYSVHVSPTSKEFTTLTHTVRLSDGKKLTTRALTDAVKSNRGFYCLFCRRCPDLSNGRYLIPEGDNAKRMQLYCKSPGGTLVYGLLVGSVTSQFGMHPDLSVIEWSFDRFKIVVLYNFIALPPHWTGNVMHNLTIPPERVPPHIKNQFRNLMRGKTAGQCASDFRDVCFVFGVRHARWLLREIDAPDLVQFVNAYITKGVALLQHSEYGKALLSKKLDQTHPPLPVDFPIPK